MHTPSFIYRPRLTLSHLRRNTRRGPSPLLAILPVIAACLLLFSGCATSSKAAPSSKVVPASATTRQPAAPPTALPRIGVYDSRAVSLAYGRSGDVARFFNDLRARHARAMEAGDRDLAKKLDEEGQSRQIRLHLQVFSNAPAEDAIEHARARLPEIAAAAGVCAIVPAADFHGTSVQVVDVTDMLVALFDPTPQTLKLVRECRDQKPLPIEMIAQMPADE